MFPISEKEINCLRLYIWKGVYADRRFYYHRPENTVQYPHNNNAGVFLNDEIKEYIGMLYGISDNDRIFDFNISFIFDLSSY